MLIEQKPSSEQIEKEGKEQQEIRTKEVHRRVCILWISIGVFYIIQALLSTVIKDNIIYSIVRLAVLVWIVLPKSPAPEMISKGLVARVYERFKEPIQNVL